MDLAKLNECYTASNWLIAKRSASAAGKALFFNNESLESLTREIASVYGLSDEESQNLFSTYSDDAAQTTRQVATNLLSDGRTLDISDATNIAKKAISSGRKIHAISAFLQAGPKAAEAAATGANIAGKSNVVGWALTAAYAAGTAGWFAYNAHKFNSEAYKIVGARENIEMLVAPPEISQEAWSENIEPIVQTVSAGAAAVTTQASAAWNGAVDKGGHLAEVTSNFFSSMTHRFAKQVPASASDQDLSPSTAMPQSTAER